MTNVSFTSAHDPHTHHHKYILSTWEILGVSSTLDGLLTQERGGHTTLLQFPTKHSILVECERVNGDQGKGLTPAGALQANRL